MTILPLYLVLINSLYSETLSAASAGSPESDSDASTVKSAVPGTSNGIANAKGSSSGSGSNERKWRTQKQAFDAELGRVKTREKKEGGGQQQPSPPDRTPRQTMVNKQNDRGGAKPHDLSEQPTPPTRATRGGRNKAKETERPNPDSNRETTNTRNPDLDRTPQNPRRRVGPDDRIAHNHDRIAQQPGRSTQAERSPENGVKSVQNGHNRRGHEGERGSVHSHHGKVCQN